MWLFHLQLKHLVLIHTQSPAWSNGAFEGHSSTFLWLEASLRRELARVSEHTHENGVISISERRSAFEKWRGESLITAVLQTPGIQGLPSTPTAVFQSDLD